MPDPNIDAAFNEIRDVLAQRDLAGVVILGNLTHLQYDMPLACSWTAFADAPPDGDKRGIRLKIDEEAVGREKALQLLRDTASHVMATVEALDSLKGLMLRMAVALRPYLAELPDEPEDAPAEPEQDDDSGPMLAQFNPLTGQLEEVEASRGPTLIPPLASLDTHLTVLVFALAESLKLQSHYAKLLNQYDGGARMAFDAPDQWLQRLHDTGQLKALLAPVMNPVAAAVMEAARIAAKKLVDGQKGPNP